nr:PEPxxWA-CTERM sorting domain-containing protein [Sphingobium subterraneum]
MWKIAAGLLALGAAGSAQAAPVFTFDFSGNSSTNGTYGNARTFSSTSSGQTLNLRATGWSINGSTINTSYLGIWDAGLGVTSAGDSNGSNNLHTVDNQGRVDFIVLEFDRAVQLTSAVFNAYQITGLNYQDTDATIRYGTNPGVWNSDPFTDGADIAAMNLLTPNSYNSDVSTTSSLDRNITKNGAAGNVWIISARTGSGADYKIDAFKLDKLTALPVLAVPEPGTWAMMIVGFGFAGAAMRRRRRDDAAARAAIA